MIKSLARVSVLVVGLVGALFASALAAAAQTANAVNSTLTDATDGAISIISTNMPKVFLVAAAFVGWKVAKRVLARV